MLSCKNGFIDLSYLSLIIVLATIIPFIFSFFLHLSTFNAALSDQFFITSEKVSIATFISQDSVNSVHLRENFFFHLVSHDDSIWYYIEDLLLKRRHKSVKVLNQYIQFKSLELSDTGCMLFHSFNTSPLKICLPEY